MHGYKFSGRRAKKLNQTSPIEKPMWPFRHTGLKSNPLCMLNWSPCQIRSGQLKETSCKRGWQEFRLTYLHCGNYWVLIATSLMIWAHQPINSFLVECLNPCLQRTSVQVGSPQPSLINLPPATISYDPSTVHFDSRSFLAHPSPIATSKPFHSCVVSTAHSVDRAAIFNDTPLLHTL